MIDANCLVTGRSDATQKTLSGVLSLPAPILAAVLASDRLLIWATRPRELNCIGHWLRASVSPYSQRSVFIGSPAVALRAGA
jgi:hypothetical protein